MVIGLYLAILYNKYPSVVVLWLFFLVPLLSGIFLPFWKRFLSVSIALDNEVEEQKKKGAMWITIENKTIFPILHGTCYLTYQHEMDQTERKVKIAFSVNARAKEKIQVPFCCDHCGVIRFRMQKVRMLDYFGIFASTKKIQEEAILVVLPQIEENFEEQKDFEQQVQQGEAIMGGLDLYAGNGEEQRDIREYRPGDSLKRIHWKLSAKRNQLMTREYEDTQEQEDILVFSALYENASEVDYTWYDRRIHTFAEITLQKLITDGPYEVIWLQPRNRQFCTAKVDREEQLYCVWEQIVRAGIGKNYPEYEAELQYYLQSGQKNRVSG